MKKETRINVGNRLRDLRKGVGKTQDEFADLLGVTPGHYRKLEAGTYELTQGHMLKLYYKYHINLTYLLTGEHDKSDFLTDFISSSRKEKIRILAEMCLYLATMLFCTLKKEDRGGN